MDDNEAYTLSLLTPIPYLVSARPAGHMHVVPLILDLISGIPTAWKTIKAGITPAVLEAYTMSFTAHTHASYS